MTADWKQLGADALTPWQEAIVELHERLSRVERLLDKAEWTKTNDGALQPILILSKTLSRATTWQSERDYRYALLAVCPVEDDDGRNAMCRH